MKDDLIPRSALIEALELAKTYQPVNPVALDLTISVIKAAPAVDAEEVFKHLHWVKEALEMAKQSLAPVVRCIDCRYSKTCNRTIELIPRQAQIGYLRCVVHSCEYGERRAEE